MSTSITRGNVLKMMALSATFDLTSRTANTTSEFDVTVVGVKVGDVVVAVNKPSLSAGIGIVNARVKAADTVAVTYVNATGAGVDPASEAYTFVIGRPEAVSLPTIIAP
jgi:hypothetical protein